MVDALLVVFEVVGVTVLLAAAYILYLVATGRARVGVRRVTQGSGVDKYTSADYISRKTAGRTRCDWLSVGKDGSIDFVLPSQTPEEWRRADPRRRLH